jgi:hypothetical protein
MMKRKGEEGQATVLVMLALSIFLLGAVGLAVDGAHLYAQRQMAQVAADAAAQAGIMSVFDGTFGSGAGTPFDCGTTTSASAPCAYARLNGFDGTTADKVHVGFPTSAPGVNLSSDPVNLLSVTVSRPVNTTLMRFLGTSTSTISATGTAAIVSVVAPVPIIITHPHLADSLSMNGNTSIKICGGPSTSIQINSNLAGYGGGGSIDLSHAGILDGGQCTTGTGADFDTSAGSATAPASISLGTTGRYVEPASAIQDPLAQVFPSGPPVPSAHVGPNTSGTTALGCPSAPCTIYSPGLYVGGLSVNNPGQPAIFQPGLYYIQGGGFKLKNATATMCPPSTCAADASTGNGMVIYNTGPAGSTPGHNPAGSFNIDTNVTATLQGATPSVGPPYYGILFFEDRTADANSHSFGQGNGCFSLIGTIYITNTLGIMKGDATHYQSVTYNGTPCSTTIQQGEIIASALSLVGTTNIAMNLNPASVLTIRQVALVK